MAESPTHKFGQIIGDMLEASMEEPLKKFVSKHDELYLDKKGPRKARGKKRKVTWQDKFGNSHDLDFVIERDGTYNKIGRPAAFIEIAWRRYTKHSRNKAQEVQGAIMPLAETYEQECPFLGIIIGGVFTQGSINQLESLGFKTLYFDYETIRGAFNVVGIDAYFKEDTPDDEVGRKVIAFNALSKQKKKKIEQELRKLKKDAINDFLRKMEQSIFRKIDSIRILPLYGQELLASNIDDAIRYLDNYRITNNGLDFVKFEIYLRFSNGDKIDASFSSKNSAIEFLKNI
ncbi:MAG: DNA methylase [Deltaproteobacteria bacterium]|nr:DNA methylase [Deltaproteobacteria bacterium]